MLENLDYLIRTLTYKRSCLECDLRNKKYSYGGEIVYVEGQIEGLTESITELYKMLNELENRKIKVL
jgi:hypothetical protein